MKTSLKVTLLLLLVFILFNVCQCSRRSDNDDKVTICFGFQDLETEFWVAVHIKGHKEILKFVGNYYHFLLKITTDLTDYLKRHHISDRINCPYLGRRYKTSFIENMNE